MPLTKCKEGDKQGWKYGTDGKCYTYESGNKSSENAAKIKAAKQGVAIAKQKGEAPHF